MLKYIIGNFRIFLFDISIIGGIMMLTRIADKSDVKNIRRIWENNRGASAFSGWFFDKVFYSGNAVVLKDDNDTVMCSSTIPYKMSFRGQEIDSSYIAGIIANPEDKTIKNMDILMADTLSFLKDKAIAFTVPEDYKLFERYGFSLCYEYKQYDISPEDLPLFEFSGKIERPESADKETLEKLKKIYKRFTQNKNGYTIREDNEWKLVIDDLYNNFGGKCAIYKNENDEVLGYILYVIRDSKMWVYELAYSRREGYEGLMAFIRMHQNVISRVILKMPSDDLSYLSFLDERRSVNLCPFAMARILDVKVILKLYRDIAPEGLRLQIIDRVIEKNNHTFTFTKGDVITIETDANVVTDIGTFTQIALGYMSVEDAFSLDLIKGDADLLKALFKKQTTYVNMLNA